MKIINKFREIISNKHEIARNWKKQGKPVIGWTCTYTPEEIIHAAGALPVRITGDLEGTKYADAYLPTNMCSFAKSCMDVALRKKYDYLDGFIASNTCDNYGKMYDVWRYHVKTRFNHMINTPHKNTGSSREFFYIELKNFKDLLEKRLGKKISGEKLKSSIRVYNENRRLLRKTYELRKKNPPVITGRETLEIVLSSTFTSKEEHNLILKQLLDEIEERSDLPEEKVRLLVSGGEIDIVEPIKIIEECGANVVADDLCTGSRYFWNIVEESNDPLKALTDRYLDQIPCPFTYQYQERFRHVMDMAKTFDVEGVILFPIKFCDTYLFDSPQLTEELKNQGYPVLNLEWEHSMTGVAGLKTRIEAFLEMIRG